MSMTKRHIDSLPQAEQDEILGVHNPDEWDDSAENEPTVERMQAFYRRNVGWMV